MHETRPAGYFVRGLPDHFSAKRTALDEGLMAFGFECAGGWFPILDGLYEVLTAHAGEAAHPPMEAVQVKEKLGGLRFYSRGDCEFCRGAVDFACALSCQICEVTARPGVMMIRDRRLRTLAEDVGIADGYQRAVLRDIANSEVTVAIEGSLPPGWRGVAYALGLMQRSEQEGLVRVIEEGGVLSASIVGQVDQACLGAFACASALAVRTDRITGVMKVPTSATKARRLI